MLTKMRFHLLTVIATITTAFAAENHSHTSVHSDLSTTEHHRFENVWSGKESLFLNDAIESLAPDSGLSATAVWMGEGWGNVNGGLKRGWQWNSLLTIGLEQDLDKLFNANGLGTVGMTLLYFESTGDFVGKNVGALSEPSNIYTVNGFRFFEIYYRNTFELPVGKLNIRIGQLAADEDFMCLEYNDIFLNENFGVIPTSMFIDSRDGLTVFSQYPLATLGVVAGYDVDDWCFRIGLYNGNAGEEKSSNYGFGYKFDSFTLWYELDYHYKIAKHEGMLIFGGNFNNGDFTKHSATDDEFSRNYYSFYLGLRQDILADSEGKAILGAFCRLGWAPKTNTADFTKYLDTGINWFAPIPGRADDVFALGVSAMETTSGFREEAAAPRFDTMLEATYKAQITKAIYLQPTCQVYFDARNSSGDKRPACVLGLRATIHF